VCIGSQAAFSVAAIESGRNGQGRMLLEKNKKEHVKSVVLWTTVQKTETMNSNEGKLSDP
jgi:uncharacterized protein YeaC (DUF1315 family)